ncbi:MAG: thioredoxin [Eubacteriaceae bacterium]|nr:thioredoxin [Eubacteriaceae bacterium]
MDNDIIVNLTEANFESEVLQSEMPVLVDFWASWCQPCTYIAPIIDELADKYEGKVKVGKLNVDESIAVAVNYQVMGIPTILIFENGEIKQQLQGALGAEEYEKAILAVVDA